MTDNQNFYLSEEQLLYYKKNGYLVIPNFITKEESEQFRKGCYRALNEEEYNCDTLGIPEFNKFSLSPKMISVVRQVLQTPAIHYLCLSQTRANDNMTGLNFRGWHSDSTPDNFDYSEDYPVINTGIYLQDHIHHSNGLKVWPGSHMHRCHLFKSFKDYFLSILADIKHLRFKILMQKLRPSRSVNIPSGPCDLIIWSMRLHHSGYAVRLKIFPNLSLPPLVENWIPHFLRLPKEKSRCAVISAFGRPSELLEKYMALQRVKKSRMKYYLNSPLTNENIINMAKLENVTLRNDGHEYFKNLQENKLSAQI